jgi:hypothetical protein
MLRLLVKCVAAFLSILLLGAIGIVGYASSQPSLPPIIVNLPNGPGSLSQEFNKRLAQRFPIGSKESDLIGELSSERFLLHRVIDKGLSLRTATYDSLYEKSFFTAGFFRYEATVTWSVNDTGQVTAISGDITVIGP